MRNIAEDIYTDRLFKVREEVLDITNAMDALMFMFELSDDVKPTGTDSIELLGVRSHLQVALKMLEKMRQRQSKQAYGFAQESVQE
jgi:hypothetical protein